MTYVPIRYYVTRTETVRPASQRGLKRKPWAVVDRRRNTVEEFDSRLAARARVFELRQLQLAEVADSQEPRT